MNENFKSGRQCQIRTVAHWLKQSSLNFTGQTIVFVVFGFITFHLMCNGTLTYASWMTWCPPEDDANQHYTTLVTNGLLSNVPNTVKLHDWKSTWKGFCNSFKTSLLSWNNKKKDSPSPAPRCLSVFHQSPTNDVTYIAYLTVSQSLPYWSRVCMQGLWLLTPVIGCSVTWVASSLGN